MRRTGRSNGRGGSGPTALNAAVCALAARRRSEAELLAHLDASGFDPDASREAVDRLRELGYLDDRELAEDVVSDLTARGIGGTARLRATLERRGLEAPVTLDESAGLAVAVAVQLERSGPRRDVRVYRRVYNALLRAGFDPEAIQEALEPQFPEASRGAPD